MKIAFDATVFQHPWTGVAKSTCALYRACLARDPQLQLIGLHQRALSAPLPENVRSIRRGRLLPSGLWRGAVLPMMIRAQRSDVVHFPWNGQVPQGLSAGAVAITLHDVLPLAIPGHFANPSAEAQYRVRIQQQLDRASLVLTVSEYSKREIMRHFRCASEPLVVTNAPTLQPPQAAGGLARAHFLYVGGYDRRKGLEPLLRMYVQLWRGGRLRTPLVLTGARDYFSADFARLVAQAVEAGAVIEKGYVSDALLSELLSTAKALVYPSKYEGFGLPPLEAMAAGCPVLTTRGTSLPEVCGEAVLYAEPEDEGQFAEALLALDTDAVLRQRLTAAGLKQAAKFSWDGSAARFIAALKQRPK